jgi:hypothetical protein
MSTSSSSGRRRFFFQAGAAVAAPLAVAGMTRRADASSVDNERLRARLAQIEAADAVRELHRRFSRHLSRGERELAAELFVDAAGFDGFDEVASLLPREFGDRDRIDISADGRSARGLFAVTAETQKPIAAEGTLVDMARAQGEGFVRLSSRGTLNVRYVRPAAEWRILRADLSFD